MLKHLFIKSAMASALIIFCHCSSAASITIPVHLTEATGVGKEIGTITLEDAKCGVLIKPNLHGLPAGVHGFHIHMNPNCDDNGMAAGSHFDPSKTNQHDGPFNPQGHLGDLPILVVDKEGVANLPSLAPRLKVSEVIGHAIIVHAGGDNYSDTPEKLGGGGARIACGIIEEKKS